MKKVIKKLLSKNKTMWPIIVIEKSEDFTPIGEIYLSEIDKP